jgi:hypothetical protein
MFLRRHTHVHTHTQHSHSLLEAEPKKEERESISFMRGEKERCCCFFRIKYYINFCLSSKIYVMGSARRGKSWSGERDSGTRNALCVCVYAHAYDVCCTMRNDFEAEFHFSRMQKESNFCLPTAWNKWRINVSFLARSLSSRVFRPLILLFFIFAPSLSLSLGLSVRYAWSGGMARNSDVNARCRVTMKNHCLLNQSVWRARGWSVCVGWE